MSFLSLQGVSRRGPDGTLTINKVMLNLFQHSHLLSNHAEQIDYLSCGLPKQVRHDAGGSLSPQGLSQRTLRFAALPELEKRTWVA